MENSQTYKDLDVIFYKNTCVKKTNTYTWCGIVDKNGRMLKNFLPDVISEFSLHIKECTQVASDMIMDDTFYKFGIHKYFHKFFKLVSPKLYMEYLYPVQCERGRYRNEQMYLFGSWYDAFYNVETFFKGVLWMFTTLQHLKDYLPFIDRVRILRVNHDFVELFGEEELEPLSLDDIIKDRFNMIDELKSNESEQLMKIVEAKAKKKFIRHEETWDNGMKIIKTDEEEKKLRSKDLPDMYDYHFEIYRKKSQLRVNDITKKKNSIPYTPPEKRTMNRNRINLVLR